MASLLQIADLDPQLSHHPGQRAPTIVLLTSFDPGLKLYV